MRTTLRIITLALLTTFAVASTTGCDKKDKAGSQEGRSKVPETREGQSFMLGQEIALAAIGQANGAKPATVSDSFHNASVMADILLEMKLDPLPKPTGDFAEDGAASLHYLLDGPGRAVGEKVHADFGESSGAAYELAVKLTMLGILYTDDPADTMADSLAEVLGRLGTTAKLPPEVLEPLITKMKARAPTSEVMDLAIGLHKTIPVAIEKVYGKPS
jgi:hypothetical protein